MIFELHFQPTIMVRSTYFITHCTFTGMSSISYMISLLLTVITVIFDSGASAPVDRQ